MPSNSDKIMPKILIADDDPSYATQIHHMIRQLSCQIRQADSGSQAIELLRESSDDILITDMYMGDMTGLDLMENALQINPDILSIAVTGQGDIDLAIEFMKRGGIDFLQKPIDKYHIIRAVESASERFRLLYENKQLKEASKKLNSELYEELLRRLNIQEELRESEKRYRDIFENAPFGIFHSSLDGQYIKANPAMIKILGYSSSEELMSQITDIARQIFVIPENRRKLIEKAVNIAEWIRCEEQFYKKDKSIILVSATFRVVRDDQNIPLYIEGFLTDITEEKKRQEIFRSEILRAKELYDLILVPQVPAMRGLGVCIKYIPAEMIGGDIVELHRIDENTILVFLADVTGHGIPAAMTANTLKLHFKDIAETQSDPAAICNFLNQTMNRMILKDDIIAAFCAKIDIGSMVMSYCLCGIPSPLILRKGQKLRLKPTAPPLGIFEDMVIPASETVCLEKEDMLIAFTDGITDIRSENGDVFGIQGVIDSIQYQTPHLIGDMLNTAIRFQKTDKFNDDIIVLTICIDDNASELLWNIFSAPDRSVFRLRTCYMNIDRLVDLVMAHIAEKFHIAHQSLSKFKIAFFELLMNAVEHGNLEMTAFKRDLKIYDSDMYDMIFIERLSSDTYGNRLIQIDLSCKYNSLKISIIDEGYGFNVENSDSHISTNNIEKPEGRGIHLAGLCADQIRYNKKGNKVTLYVRLDPAM